MEKASDYHQDIYSGMVAKELGKEGYFGESVSKYGFLVWQNEDWILECDDDQELCGEKWIEAMKCGKMISSIESINFRVFGKDDMLKLACTAERELYEKLLLKNKQTIIYIFCTSYNHCYVNQCIINKTGTRCLHMPVLLKNLFCCIHNFIQQFI